MGSCSSSNDKKQKNITKKKIIQNQIPEKKEEEKKENPLKASPVKPNIRKETEAEVEAVKPLNITKKRKFTVQNLDTGENILNLSFNENDYLKEVFSKIPFDKNSDYHILDEKNIKLNDKSNRKIKDLFKEKEINLKIKYAGLEIPNDIRKAYLENNNLIGSLILDNPDYFGIVIIDTTTQNINLFRFTNEESSQLRKFNLFSAICNGQNKLFISGGENESNINEKNRSTKFFYVLDLSNIKDHNLQCRQLIDLIEPRIWHSMIYIPPKYIFIVGGTNSKSVELYNIETNDINLDSELGEPRDECSLCMVNDTYLYAFCGFMLHHTFISSIERCNLRKENREWDFVDYKCENSVEFIPSFFGVAYYGNDKLLLLGGNENPDEQNKNYVYSFGLDENPDFISEYNNLQGGLINIYREKFFIPINDRISINIPLIVNEIQIFYLDKDEGQITKGEYDSNLNEDL